MLTQRHSVIPKTTHTEADDVQKERLLQREVHMLRTELNKQSARVTEAVAAEQRLRERVQGLQKEANEKDGLYHAKCKELSVAKIRGGPSGIGVCSLFVLRFTNYSKDTKPA